MKKYLLFRLYGAMASWGDIAVGTHRPSSDHPSKSAIMGLLAAALGIRREDEMKHKELAEAYNFAVVVNSAGSFLRDYHTSQVPSSSSIKKQNHIFSRKDELGIDKKDLNTILSSRDYYCDSFYTIAIWEKNGEGPYPIEVLEKKLREPEFVLYLGRKSCPLALPVEAMVLNENSLLEAFGKAEFKCQEFFENIKNQDKNTTNPENTRIYWEGEENGLQPVHTNKRRDMPLSRKRWQFAARKEQYMMLDMGD